MTHNYKSNLREKIAAFLDLKLKQGFIYKNQSILLNELDGYLALNHPTATTITRDWALEWIAPRREAEKPGTTNKRITILRELGKFISLTEPKCYVIENNVNVRGNTAALPHHNSEGDAVIVGMHSRNQSSTSFSSSLSKRISPSSDAYVPYWYEIGGDQKPKEIRCFIGRKSPEDQRIKRTRRQKSSLI